MRLEWQSAVEGRVKGVCCVSVLRSLFPTFNSNRSSRMKRADKHMQQIFEAIIDINLTPTRRSSLNFPLHIILFPFIPHHSITPWNNFSCRFSRAAHHDTDSAFSCSEKTFPSLCLCLILRRKGSTPVPERSEMNWEFSSCLNFHEFRCWIDDKTYCRWLQSSWKLSFFRFKNAANKGDAKKNKRNVAIWVIYIFTERREGGKSRAGIFFLP